MGFKVGDEVVCVKSHSLGIVKKGEKHIVENTTSKLGGCIQVDGVTAPHGRLWSGYTAWAGERVLGLWLSNSLFRKVETNKSTVDELLEEIVEEVEQEKLETA